MKSSFLAFLILGFMLFLSCNSNEKASNGTQATKYTCPMHPQVVKDGPGSCPICKMDLVPMHIDAVHSSADDSLKSLVKPTDEHVLSGIKIIKPERGSRSLELDLQGIINYNTNNWKSVSSRVSGRIERLFIKYNYERVNKGQKIMEIYSPDLANAQQELLFLKNSDETVLLEAAKKKLRYLGMAEGQIGQVLRSGKIIYRIPVYSPYSGYVAEPQANSSSAAGSGGLAGGTNISSENSSGMSSMSSGSSADNVPVIPEINSGQSLQIREGQYVSAGQKLFNLINVEQVWAEFYSRPDQLEEFKRGSMVKVQSVDIPAQQSRVPVSLIQPYYNEGSNYSLIRAMIPNSSKVWKIGQLVSVTKESEVEGTWLPGTAV